MAQALTKPQVAMLSRAMREDVQLKGHDYRVAGRLVGLGLGNIKDQVFRVNIGGLNALRHHRVIKYANSGSVASRRDLDEVEVAIGDWVSA